MISYHFLADLETPDVRATPGGSCTIYVVRLRDLFAMPRHIPGIASMEPLLIKPETEFYTYRFDADSVRLADSSRSSRQGERSNISLEGYRSNLDIDHQLQIEKLRPGYYIVLWEDAEGRRRLLGTPDRPMKFSYSADSGRSDQDTTRATWRFEGVQVGLSCYMSSILPIPQVITTPCAVLGMSDFETPVPAIVADAFQGVNFVPAAAGNIASITGYPTGSLVNVSQNFGYGPIYYQSASQRYEPLTPVALSPGIHRILIPSIPVLISGSVACSITFLHEFTFGEGAFDLSFSEAYDIS